MPYGLTMTSHRRTLHGLILLSLGVLGPLGCASVVPSVAEPPAGEAGSTLDVSEALEVLKTSAEDWSAGDLERFVSVYAEDCLFITSSGLTRGRDAVLARYRERYPDPQAMGMLQLEVLETRPAPPDGLTVAARWILAYPDRPAASGHTLIVFRRIDGQWRIVQDASM
jgi:uncharacterized protein (TIGR02246 family)